MLAQFNDLPDEIILKITDDLPDLRSLRSVSNRLNSLIEPIVFKEFKIRPGSFPKKQICEAITTELASTAQTVYSRGTKNADIQFHPDSRTEEHKPWLEVVILLVPTLMHLQSLRWDYRPSTRYESGFTTRFIHSLGLLPRLEDLSIIFSSNNFPPDFSLQPLSNLLSIFLAWRRWTERPPPHVIQEVSNLLSRCPDLESLALEIPQLYPPENPPSFGDLFSSLASMPPDVCLKISHIFLTGFPIAAADFIAHSRHFKRLETLTGDPLQTSTSTGEICEFLEKERIYLDAFFVGSVHPPEVFHYISSYSGLDRLCLCPNQPDDNSPELVDQFFFSVLPLHLSSLRSLEVGTDLPTAWTNLDERHLGQIEKCTSLRILSCRLCCKTPQGDFTDTLLIKWLRTATRLLKLRIIVCRPTSVVPKVVVGRGMAMYGGGPDFPDLQVQKFAREVAKGFEREHKTEFIVSVY